MKSAYTAHNTSISVPVFVCHSLTAVTLCLLTFSGAWGGENQWTTTGPGGGASWALAIDPANSQAVYVGTWQGGMFRSGNGGASWAHVGLAYPDVRAVAIGPVNSQTVYAGTYAIGVFKSGDGGGQWTQTTSGLTSSVTSLKIDPANPQTVYAGTYGSGVFKSGDGGGQRNVVTDDLVFCCCRRYGTETDRAS